MRRLLLQCGQRSGGLIDAERAVALVCGSIRRQRTIRGVEYAKDGAAEAESVGNGFANGIGSEKGRPVGVRYAKQG